MSKKKAIILFNLGGPDSLSSVKGFLFNLFYDPAIITLPNPLRWMLAKFISIKRESKAIEIYKQMGGKSPILDITKQQAKLLEEELNDPNIKVFVCMRYWHPFAHEVIKELIEFQPEELILLPLYPQYSTTTTKSSFDEFKTLLEQSSLKMIKPKFIYNYHLHHRFIKAHAELIEEALPKVKNHKFRILFSAHSLPERIIKKGDPYQKQIEETVEGVVKELNQNIDYVVCYQSKVGPLKWITPATEDEIEKAAKEDLAIIVVPIAFVSDHSETLVELDIEYKELFEEYSTKPYIRVKALNDSKNFTLCLKEII